MRKKQKFGSITNNEMECRPQENKILTEQNQKAHGNIHDVIFIHENIHIYSHAHVLVLFSPYLKDLLTRESVQWKDKWCNKTPLMINLADVLKHHEQMCCECFKNIIDYMYTSKIHIREDHLKHVEYAARLLQISELINVCAQYSISKNNIALNSTNNNKYFEKTSTGDIELLPNKVDNIINNRKLIENIYDNLYHKEITSTTVHCEEKVSTEERAKLLKTKSLNNTNSKLAQNTIIKDQNMKLRKHQRTTYKPYSKSASSKTAINLLDIKTNQRASLARKLNTIPNNNMYSNKQTKQNDDETITDVRFNTSGQKTRCSTDGSAELKTHTITETLSKEACNREITCKCVNEFSTSTTNIKMSANLNEHKNPLKLREDKTTEKDNTPSNTKHVLSPVNHIQSNSLCERPTTTNKSGTRPSTSINEIKRTECNNNIRNKRINVRKNTNFTCDVCEYKTSDLHMIIEHLENNDHNQTHCSICTYKFKDNKEFKIHLNVHKEKMPFLCLKCNRKFVKLCNFKKHLLTHDNEKPLICSICSKIFKTLHGFTKHMIKQHNENKGRIYSCENCSYYTGFKDDLITHLNNDCIPLSALRSSAKIQSLTPSSDTVPIRCNNCDYCTTKQKLYKKHVRKWHNVNEKSLGNSVSSRRNSVGTSAIVNNSLQMTAGNNTKDCVNNSNKLNNLLVGNDTNTTNKHQITHMENIFKNNEHIMLPVNNNEQLQNINTEQSVMLPITEDYKLSNTVLTHSTATNDILLLLNTNDKDINTTYLIINSAIGEQLNSDNFNFEGNDNTGTNLSNIERSLNLSDTVEGEQQIFDFSYVEDCCNQQDVACSSDSFCNQSISNTILNSGDEFNNGYLIPSTHCREEYSVKTYFENTGTNLSNTERSLCLSDNIEGEEQQIFDFSYVEDGCNQQDAACSSDPFCNQPFLNNLGDENNNGYFIPSTQCREEYSIFENETTIQNVQQNISESTNFKVVHSRNNGGDLMRNVSFDVNEEDNIMPLNDDKYQSNQFGNKDPCTSDRYEIIFQKDLETTDVFDEGNMILLNEEQYQSSQFGVKDTCISDDFQDIFPMELISSTDIFDNMEINSF